MKQFALNVKQTGTYINSCVCVTSVRLVDSPAGVTHNLPSAVLTLIFIARRIQPSLSLVVREVEFCVLYPRINPSPLVGHDFFSMSLKLGVTA